MFAFIFSVFAFITDAMRQRALRVRPSKGMEEYIAKALGHYLRVQILWILNERSASPSELADELGVALNRVSNHIKVLKDADCVEVVDEVIVGNSVQRFYRATARIFFDETDWPTVPATVQAGLRTTLLKNLVDDAVEAVRQGIYDSLEGSHMSWTPAVLDELGREEVRRLLKQTLNEVLAIQEGAEERLRAADAEGISYSISILGYPSIGGTKKVGPPNDAKRITELPKGRKAKAKPRRKPAKAKGGKASKAKGRNANHKGKTQRDGGID